MKKHDEFSPVIRTTVKLCDFLRGADTNVAFQWLLDFYRESFPKGLLHPCPYQSLSAYNVSVDTKLFVSNNLKGIYRANLRIFDDEDDNIVTWIQEFELYLVNDKRLNSKFNQRH